MKLADSGERWGLPRTRERRAWQEANPTHKTVTLGTRRPCSPPIPVTKRRLAAGLKTAEVPRILTAVCAAGAGAW